MCSDDSSSSPVKQLLECVPAAVKQHAVRGRACILKQQGDCEDAKALLSELVQSKQQFADVQHLAQADYGALLHEQGKLKVCAALLCHIVVQQSLAGIQVSQQQVVVPLTKVALTT